MKKNTSKLLVALLASALLVGCGGTSSSETPSVSSEPSVSTSSLTASTSSEVSSIVSSEVPSVVSSEEPSVPSSSEEVLPGEAIRLGTAADAVTHAGELVLEAGPKVGLTYARTVEEVSRVEFTVSEGAAYDEIKLHLKNADAVTSGRYTLTFKVNPSVAFTGLVNNEPTDFIRGENEVTVHYDEPEGASLTFIFNVNEAGINLKANNVSFSDFLFVAREYDSVEDIVVDAQKDDWVNTRAYENTVGVHGVTPNTEHKSVDFYATLTSTGLFLLAEAYHDIYISEAGQWWQATNFEFFIKGNNQRWVSARQEGGTFTKSAGITEAAWITTPLTEEGMANYHSIVEVFIAKADLPAGAIVAGEVRVGFAWKTDGDVNTGGEAAGGGEDVYWVPAGTWVNNADQQFVDVNGIHDATQVSFDPQTMTIDGDLADWADKATYTTNKVYLEGSEATSHKNVTFYAFINEEGLFLAALAHHDVFINDAADWYKNTNFEFFVNGGNQYYVAANGAVAYGAGEIVSNEYDQGAEEAVYETVAEVFIPIAVFGDVDMLRVGFAWKTDGDTATGLGGNGGAADAWWFAAGHFPNNGEEQYYVTADGIFANDPFTE